MKVYWTRTETYASTGYIYYFKSSNWMRAKLLKGKNKKRRPEYIFLSSIPYYTRDVDFSDFRFFEINDRYVENLL